MSGLRSTHSPLLVADMLMQLWNNLFLVSAFVLVGRLLVGPIGVASAETIRQYILSVPYNPSTQTIDGFCSTFYKNRTKKCIEL
jgi:hypothetical protein